MGAGLAMPPNYPIPATPNDFPQVVRGLPSVVGSIVRFVFNLARLAKRLLGLERMRFVVLLFELHDYLELVVFRLVSHGATSALRPVSRNVRRGWALHEPLAHAPLVLSLDLDDRLEQDRLVIAERRRFHNWAVLGLNLRRSGLEDESFSVVPADAPHSTAASHEHAHGRTGAGPPNLDVSIGKAEFQNRRWLRAAVIRRHERFARESRSAGLAQLLVCRLDVDRRRPVLDDPSNHPGTSPVVDRFAHSRKRSLCSGVLEVTVGEPDHKRVGCDVRPPVSRAVPMPLLSVRETRPCVEAA